MKLKCTVGATDVTSYLKGYSVQPGGGGVVGTGTIYLDQDAGGLDLRVRQEVKLWVPFDQSAGTGVAQRGRLFHGLVALRNTGNVGTTKTWSLTCGDMNALNHLLVRDVQPAKAVTLTAGTFAAQIAALVGVIQSNGFGLPAKVIDSTTGVVSFYASMPAVTMEPGHKLGWYIQQLCNKVREFVPTVFPRFYIGTLTTFGAGDTFGQPVLYIYDGALTPGTTVTYSDTPTGSDRVIYPPFSRVTDGGGDRVLQRQQALYGPEQSLVVTALNDPSQTTYPNEWLNHGRPGNTGYWMGEPLKLGVNTSAEAQALVDASVNKTANPGDSFQWTTRDLVQPYDVVGLKWDLEGIPAGTPYRIARVEIRDVRELDPEATIQVNSRRRGLLDDGSDEWPLLPIEGDRVPPLPPVSASLGTQTWDWPTMRAALPLTIGASPSPDVGGYRVQGTLAGEPFVEDVGMNLTPILYLAAGLIFSFQVFAYDHAGNISVEGAPASPITGTTMDAPLPPAPTSLAVTRAFQGDNEVIVRATWTHSVLPEAYRDRYEIQYYPVGQPARAHVVPVDRASTEAEIAVSPWITYGFKIRTVGLGSVMGPWSSEVQLRGLPVEVHNPYNNSFEIGYKQDPTIADGWTVTLVGSGLAGRAQGGAKDGLWTFQFLQLNTGALGNAQITSEFFRVQGGVVHGFGYWRKGSADARADFYVDWYNSSYGLISTSTLWTDDQAPSVGLWNERTATATAPSGAAVAKVRIFADAVANVNAGYEIDLINGQPPITGSQLEDSGVSAASYLWPNVTFDKTGRATAAESNSGTSFPGSPATGRVFFRTDLGVLCYYDGTRWLGDKEVATWIFADSTSQMPVSATCDGLFTKLPRDRDSLLTRVEFAILVNGTHTLGNFWEIELERFTGSTWVSVGRWPTDKITNGWSELAKVTADFSNSGIVPSTDRWLKHKFYKTSGPGPLSVVTRLEYRRIYT